MRYPIFQIEVNEPYPELNGGQNNRRPRGPVHTFHYIYYTVIGGSANQFCTAVKKPVSYRSCILTTASVNLIKYLFTSNFVIFRFSNLFPFFFSSEAQKLIRKLAVDGSSFICLTCGNFLHAGPIVSP